jgi:hypothetical protein
MSKFSNDCAGHSSHDGGASNAFRTVSSQCGGRTQRRIGWCVRPVFLLHVVCRNVNAVGSTAEHARQHVRQAAHGPNYADGQKAIEAVSRSAESRKEPRTMMDRRATPGG